MNVWLEYLLELNLYNDPVLYSIYVSALFSFAVAKVWVGYVNSTNTAFSRSVQLHEVSTPSVNHLEPTEPHNDIAVWMVKTIKRKDDSSEEDHCLVIHSS